MVCQSHIATPLRKRYGNTAARRGFRRSMAKYAKIWPRNERNDTGKEGQDSATGGSDGDWVIDQEEDRVEL